MPSMSVSRTATPSSLNPNGTKRTKICVYCGASPGHDPAHMEAARQLAREMAKNNIALGYLLHSLPSFQNHRGLIPI
jgi:hypothetical protein